MTTPLYTYVRSIGLSLVCNRGNILSSQGALHGVECKYGYDSIKEQYRYQILNVLIKG